MCFRLTILMASCLAMTAAAENSLIINPGFESGGLEPWKGIGSVARLRQDRYAGAWGVQLGAGPGMVEQTVAVKAASTYRLKAWLCCSSGAMTVNLGVKGHGGPQRTAATPRVEWTLVELPFTTSPITNQATVFVQASAEAWVDDVSLTYVGPAEQPSVMESDNSILAPEPRVPSSDLGVDQLSNSRLDWLLDQRFGLFIHWGLYAGPGHGEWMMNNQAVPPEKYRTLATLASGDDYFAADRFNPKDWVQLAKDAGMKWLCLTARHHDGFNLFNVPHPNAFTSTQTHQRDYVSEYVSAVREAGLGVGLYFSPLNWRYPGYFDPNGSDCAKNQWGYTTDPAHRENARLMKEENYVAVKQLLTSYGPLDHIFWDGGWLRHQGSDADSAYFHEPGRFLDPANPWPIDRQYLDLDPTTGKALGIMGLVRRYQPNAITNYRYGWMGDIGEEEGGATISGPVRSAQIVNKCLTMHGGGWGYSKDALRRGEVMSRDEIIRMLADCTMRNMTMLLNVGPDRHGEIPPLAQERLREVGIWLAQTGEAIYGTRGGPWNPEDGRYGYSRKGDTIYVHLLKDQPGNTFTLPPVGPLKPLEAKEVMTGRALVCTQAADRTVTIVGIDRNHSPADTVIAVRFDQDVMTYARTRY